MGGSPRIVVLDNLREGVIKADLYEPKLNPLFKDVLAHYGVIAMPCRVQDPDRKDQASYCTRLDIFDVSWGNCRRSRNRLPGCAWGSGPL